MTFRTLYLVTFASLAAFVLVVPRGIHGFVASSTHQQKSVCSSSSIDWWTRLHANVASEILRDDLEETPNNNNNNNDDNVESNNKKSRKILTRPERKALERARKAQRRQGHRRHNYAERSKLLQGKRKPGEGRYDLHSTSVSQLTKESSTPDDVMRAIKRAQNLHDVHDMRAIERFLLEEAPETFAYGFFGSLLARLAVAALHLNENELARKALDVRTANHRSSMLPMESAAIVRGLLRVNNITHAIEVLEDELTLPTPGTNMTTEENRELIKHRALSIGSIASRHFYEGEPLKAVEACQWLVKIGPFIRQSKLTPEEIEMPWDRIAQGAASCESARRDGKFQETDDNDDVPCNLVYAVLNAMTTFPSANDDRTYEIISNALVRRVVFVTGAINMKGCPEEDRGEAAFIGRSNVGKSSLINMITNRKSIAYTSKTPGKTQQFNYFAVNDKVELARQIRYGDNVKGEKDRDSFYIVDLPGFGFAKVPQYQRQDWSNFMQQYIQNRKTLRVVFHLVDARHGSTPEDARIMSTIGAVLPKGVSYVVVLTKADKNVKAAKKKRVGKVSRDVMDSLLLTMKENGVSGVPVVLTSAETKVGRDELWRYLRLAAES